MANRRRSRVSAWTDERPWKSSLLQKPVIRVQPRSACSAWVRSAEWDHAGVSQTQPDAHCRQACRLGSIWSDRFGAGVGRRLIPGVSGFSVCLPYRGAYLFPAVVALPWNRSALASGDYPAGHAYSAGHSDSDPSSVPGSDGRAGCLACFVDSSLRSYENSLHLIDPIAAESFQAPGV